MNADLTRRLIAVISVLFFLAMACNMPTAPVGTPVPAETRVAQTVQARITELASGTTPGAETTHATPEPGQTSQPTGDQTRTAQPSPTATSECDQASFITDITVPDGTAVTAGTQFTKIWRLRNTGTCTWTPEYAVVFDSGDQMEGPAAQPLGKSVLPGEVVDVSVPLRAPGAPGNYRGFWKLRNAANAVFGTGPSDMAFFVDIESTAAPAGQAGYDFTANYCVAEWTGITGEAPEGRAISCIARDGDPNGFVRTIDNPILEGGYVDDEPALLAQPPEGTNTIIRGKYPPYTVRQGDRFMAIISCEHNAENCSVRFQLDYQVDSGPIQTLASWEENHNGQFTPVSHDLNNLAGQTVRFILTVHSNGPANQDRAVWLLPRIDSQ